MRTIFDTKRKPEDRLRALSQALIIVSTAVFILFGCGLIVSRAISQGTIQSTGGTSWTFENIRSLAREFFDDIFRDESIKTTVEPRIALPKITNTEPAFTLTSTRSPSEIPHDPTSSSTSVPPSSLTPTANTTQSPSPSTTETPSETLTPTVAITPTSTQSIDFSTLWLSSERVSSLYKLVGAQPNGSGAQASDNVTFAIGDIPAGTSLLSGSATIHFYAAYPGDAEGSILFLLGAGSDPFTVLGEDEIKIPGNTASPMLFSITFDTVSYQYAAQGEFRLRISLSAPGSIYWDGEWNDARIILPPVSP